MVGDWKWGWQICARTIFALYLFHFMHCNFFFISIYLLFNTKLAFLQLKRKLLAAKTHLVSHEIVRFNLHHSLSHSLQITGGHESYDLLKKVLALFNHKRDISNFTCKNCRNTQAAKKAQVTQLWQHFWWLHYSTWDNGPRPWYCNIQST